MYYVAADEVTWDYAPSGMNKITGKPFDDLANIWMKRGPDRIGHVYRKALYREYTDGTFTTLKPHPAAWEHLGFQGPLLRAEVGDTIRVVFRNNTRRPASMHPHGVFYKKDSEGAPYEDDTAGADKADDAVPPGGTHTYVWPVPERAGPAAHDASSVLWMYHSHVDEEKDMNAGLIGPMIVTSRGMAKPDGSPKDVDREFVTLFAEMDENLSHYLDENIQAYAEKPASVQKGTTFVDPFYLSNLKENVNGFVFGNGPMMTMQVGERVRWYVYALTNFEIHSPHWHANTVVAMNMRTDTLPLMPMGMIVADMVPDNPGTWLFHCHVGPHFDAGMISRYTVVEAAARAR
jgi:FtsP/CotA-like multicopper oxidase with cupredoxin domain